MTFLDFLFLLSVTQANTDPTEQTIGSQLIMNGIHSYADLNEVIVNHMQVMACWVED